MRTIRLGFLLAAMGSAACVLSQSVTLDAYEGGKIAGNIVCSRTIKGQSQTSVTTFNMNQNGKKTNIVMTAIFDRSGATRSRTAEIHQGGKTYVLKATFKGTEAKVAITAEGKNESRTIASTSKASAADVTNWWFTTGAKPKVGTKAKYQIFNIIRGVWQDVDAQYIGDKPVKVGGRTVVAHLVTENGADGLSKMYLDDKGLPLVIEQPKFRFVRR